jgi:hypothetical protein
MNPAIPTQAGLDWRGRLKDGLLAGLGYVLMELVILLLIQPIQAILGQPGTFVYAILLLAAAMLSLEHGLHLQRDELAQAAWGALAGLLAWIFIEYSGWLSGQSTATVNALFSYVLCFLVVWVLWRRTAFLGLRYFCLVFLAGWGGHLALAGLTYASSLNPGVEFLPLATGILALAAMLLALGALFTRARSRLECLNAGLALWAAATTAIYLAVYLFNFGMA